MSGMTYRGQVKGGVVVFEEAIPPEGATVRVEVESPPAQVAGDEPSLWDKLRRFSGAAKGLPPDMARNHDHYIHGGRKK
jgi:hypothetical protein